MLLNKGPIANSMGLNPQATTQYAKPIRNFLTSPSTIAKGFGRLGGILSGLVHSNEAVAAEKPGFFDQLQKQGMTQPHEQQQVMQGIPASAVQQPLQGALMSREHWTRGDEGGDEGANDGRPYFTEPSNTTSTDTSSGGSTTYGPNHGKSFKGGRGTKRNYGNPKEIEKKYPGGSTTVIHGITVYIPGPGATDNEISKAIESQINWK